MSVKTMLQNEEAMNEECLLTEYVESVYNNLFINSLTHTDNEENICFSSLSLDV